MRASVAKDLSASALEFERVVAPAILPHIGGGELVSSESVSAEGFHKDLDVLAGIDGWHLVRNKHLMRGIASRVQWGKNWRTFTIRKSRDSGAPTELEKRLRAILTPAKGFLYPHLTVHAYISERGGELLGVGIARTDQLIPLAKQLSAESRFVQRTHNAEFVYVPWDVVVQRGLQFVEVVGRNNNGTRRCRLKTPYCPEGA